MTCVARRATIHDLLVLLMPEIVEERWSIIPPPLTLYVVIAPRKKRELNDYSTSPLLSLAPRSSTQRSQLSFFGKMMIHPARKATAASNKTP